MDLGNLTVNPPETARRESPNVLQRTPARPPTSPLANQYSPPAATVRWSPNTTSGVVVKSASIASVNGPCTPVGSARGANAAPTLNCRCNFTIPLPPSNSGALRFRAVSPNRTSHADTMAPASRSTVVRVSPLDVACGDPEPVEESTLSTPPRTSLAVVPITSPGTTVCTTVTPTFVVVSVRTGTSPDPSFCRSGEPETVAKPVA